MTEAQKEFFKDSKVRDNHNNLICVYHGSKTKGFDEFRYDPNKQTGTDYGEAYYFTSDYEKAKGYSYDSTKDPRIEEWQTKKKALINKFLETQDPADKQAISALRVDGKTLTEILAAGDYDTGGEVLECYLNLQNPLIVDGHGENYNHIYDNAFKEARNNNHDGIIIRNVQDNPRGEFRNMDVYVAFKPEQIKSVDNLYPTHSKNFRDNSKEYFKDINPLDAKIQMAKDMKTINSKTNTKESNKEKERE